ncbi:MAG: DUF4296 domain-containing protein [Bacteroidales bacterium]|nr:DUF4296 domain-containing protein [Bacteroidales bacterium]
MIQRVIIIILLLVTQLSCNNISNHQKPTPENLISRNEMVDIFVDIQLVEAILTQKQKKTPDIKFHTNNYYKSIFEKHNITQKDFEENLQYYQQNIEKLDEIFADVITHLSMKQSEINK